MSSELADIMNEASADDLREQASPKASTIGWEENCEEYLRLTKEIKAAEKLLEPIKAALKKVGDHSTNKYQVVMTNVESFRMKGLKVFEEKGYTKERIIKEGIGGFSTSKRIGVSKL